MFNFLFPIAIGSEFFPFVGGSCFHHLVVEGYSYLPAYVIIFWYVCSAFDTTVLHYHRVKGVT